MLVKFIRVIILQQSVFKFWVDYKKYVYVANWPAHCIKIKAIWILFSFLLLLSCFQFSFFFFLPSYILSSLSSLLYSFLSIFCGSDMDSKINVIRNSKERNHCVNSNMQIELNSVICLYYLLDSVWEKKITFVCALIFPLT